MSLLPLFTHRFVSDPELDTAEKQVDHYVKVLFTTLGTMSSMLSELDPGKQC